MGVIGINGGKMKKVIKNSVLGVFLLSFLTIQFAPIICASSAAAPPKRTISLTGASPGAFSVRCPGCLIRHLALFAIYKGLQEVKTGVTGLFFENTGFQEVGYQEVATKLFRIRTNQDQIDHPIKTTIADFFGGGFGLLLSDFLSRAFTNIILKTPENYFVKNQDGTTAFRNSIESTPLVKTSTLGLMALALKLFPDSHNRAKLERWGRVYHLSPEDLTKVINTVAFLSSFIKLYKACQETNQSILVISSAAVISTLCALTIPNPKNRRLRRALTYLKRTQGFYTDYVVSQKPEFTDLTSAVVSRARRWWDQRRVPLLP